MAFIDAHKIDDTSFDYIYEQDVTVKLKSGNFVRCNVYRPKKPDDGRYPVLLTYGPYGKDVHYKR
jgi:predicted acyl esterase